MLLQNSLHAGLNVTTEAVFPSQVPRRLCAESIKRKLRPHGTVPGSLEARVCQQDQQAQEGPAATKRPVPGSGRSEDNSRDEREDSKPRHSWGLR